MRTYDVTFDQLKGIARLCYQEQGTTAGSAAEASLMCNLYDKRGIGYSGLYDYVRSCGWWAKAAHFMDNGECPDDVLSAVEDVICHGNRTLPDYIDEHDCFSDISSISTGDVYDRNAYVKDVTVIKNHYGAVYTFYCFPAPGSDPFGYTSKDEPVTSPTDKTEEAISWIEFLAADDAHGYDQAFRWGEHGDYDCSSAVITAWDKAGVPTGATYTGDMYNSFLASGFEDVTKDVDLDTGDGLERGDVLLNKAHHTAMYCGNGREVEASINEEGGATGGQPGDQTGREILVRPYRNFPWDCVLRYGGDKYTLALDSVSEGSVGRSVLLLQLLLRGWGYKGADGNSLERDGELGSNTMYALQKWQRNHNLTVDGICGQATWQSLTQAP